MTKETQIPPTKRKRDEEEAEPRPAKQQKVGAVVTRDTDIPIWEEEDGSDF